jgi:hypothetical protein
MAWEPDKWSNSDRINRLKRKHETDIEGITDNVDDLEEKLALNELIHSVQDIADKHDVKISTLLDKLEEKDENVQKELKSKEALHIVKENLISVFDHGSNDLNLLGFEVSNEYRNTFDELGTYFFIHFEVNGRKYEVEDNIYVRPEQAGHGHEFGEKVADAFIEKVSEAIAEELLHKVVNKDNFQEQCGNLLDVT